MKCVKQSIPKDTIFVEPIICEETVSRKKSFLPTKGF